MHNNVIDPRKIFAIKRKNDCSEEVPEFSWNVRPIGAIIQDCRTTAQQTTKQVPSLPPPPSPATETFSGRGLPTATRFRLRLRLQEQALPNFDPARKYKSTLAILTSDEQFLLDEIVTMHQ